MLITRLFLFLEVCNVTPTYRKSWAKNLLMWSDFTLGSSFKVKRWLMVFGEFSFWWIQFASVLRCARSCCIWYSVSRDYGLAEHFHHPSLFVSKKKVLHQLIFVIKLPHLSLNSFQLMFDFKCPFTSHAQKKPYY